MTRITKLERVLDAITGRELSVRQIAAEVGLPVRTVENAVQIGRSKGLIEVGAAIVPRATRKGRAEIHTYRAVGTYTAPVPQGVFAPADTAGIVPAALQARTALEQAWGGRDA